MQQQRKLELITVNHVLPSKSSTRVIVVLARAHPGESVTSFVCQGFLEFLLGSHPTANTLREHFIFKIVPMLNPDGVFLGNNRCNLIGQDMNRSWNIATEFSHPTIVAAKRMLRELDSCEVIGKIDAGRIGWILNRFILLIFQSYQLDFVLDLHAHTTSLGTSKQNLVQFDCKSARKFHIHPFQCRLIHLWEHV